MGIWWCRTCHRETTFVILDPQQNDPDFSECENCGFFYGKRIDQMAVDPITGERIEKVLPTLPKSVVDAGRAKFAREETLRRARDGIPMMVAPKVETELKRRRGLD